MIDDSPLIREAARLALEETPGWEVLVADSGEQGIALAEATRPDAILLDVVMPDMDGYSVVEELQSKPATGSLPVVLLTATDADESRSRAGHLAVEGVIAKPFRIERLAGELAALLDWAR